MSRFSNCRPAVSFQWTLPLALLLAAWVSQHAYGLQQSATGNVRRGHQEETLRQGLSLHKSDGPVGRTTPANSRPEDRQLVLSNGTFWPPVGPDTVTVYDAIDGPQRYSFTYDAGGNLLMVLYEDGNGSQWVDHFRVRNTYDGSGNRLRELKEWRNGARWEWDWRYTFTYDDTGNRLTEMREWRGRSGQNWRHTYTYDGSGNRITATHEWWDGTQLVNHSRYTYTYDGSGNRLTDVYEQWDGTQWMTRGRDTYTYDGSGNRLAGLSEVWNGTEWFKSGQSTYTYDESGNRLTEVYEGLSWPRMSSRHTFTYDGTGNRLTELYQTGGGGQWVNHWRYTYTYDGTGNRITELHETWDGAQWVNDWRYTYTYDARGNLTLFNSEVWSVSEWVSWSGTLRIQILEDFYHDWTLSGHEIILQYSEIVTSIDGERDGYPLAYGLSQNYPNPFNPTTTISYDLPQAADVTLAIYDVLGRQIRELASGTKPAGGYEVSFDATGLPSGVYFYRLQAGDYVETRRMVVVK